MNDLFGSRSYECHSWVDEDEDGRVGGKGQMGDMKHGKAELIRVFQIEPREFMSVYRDGMDAF
jgi:hypothetical protein